MWHNMLVWIHFRNSKNVVWLHFYSYLYTLFNSKGVSENHFKYLFLNMHSRHFKANLSNSDNVSLQTMDSPLRIYQFKTHNLRMLSKCRITQPLQLLAINVQCDFADWFFTCLYLLCYDFFTSKPARQIYDQPINPTNTHLPICPSPRFLLKTLLHLT